MATSGPHHADAGRMLAEFRQHWPVLAKLGKYEAQNARYSEGVPSPKLKSFFRTTSERLSRDRFGGGQLSDGCPGNSPPPLRNDMLANLYDLRLYRLKQSACQNTRNCATNCAKKSNANQPRGLARLCGAPPLGRSSAVEIAARRVLSATQTARAPSSQPWAHRHPVRTSHAIPCGALRPR